MDNDGKCGNYDQLMDCIGKLGEEQEGDDINTETEVDVQEEVAGRESFEDEYNQFVKGESAEVFQHACNTKCPDAETEGIPGEDLCRNTICPFLEQCVVDFEAEPKGVAGDFHQLVGCLEKMSNEKPKEVTEAVEAEAGAELTTRDDEDHQQGEVDLAAEYNEHVSGKGYDQFEFMCGTHCPDHTGNGMPTQEMCSSEGGICDNLWSCVSGGGEVAGDF